MDSKAENLIQKVTASQILDKMKESTDLLNYKLLKNMTNTMSKINVKMDKINLSYISLIMKYMSKHLPHYQEIYMLISIMNLAIRAKVIGH